MECLEMIEHVQLQFFYAKYIVYLKTILNKSTVWNVLNTKTE